MTDMMKALIVQLERAEAGVREVDMHLAALEAGIVIEQRGNDFYSPDDEIVGSIDPGKHSRNFRLLNRFERDTPRYSASLDDALRLAQSVLPAWFPHIGQNVHYGHWRGGLQIVEETNGDITRFDGEHRTSPASALCIAVLKASAAQGGA